MNTRSPISGNDELGSPADLAAFLTRRGVSDVGDVTWKDLDAVRGVRQRLRTVFTSEDPAVAAAQINRLVAESRALPQLTDHDGTWHLHFTPPGAALATRIAAETAMGLAIVVRDDGVQRFRVCASDTCADVFVDTSRNRSRRYCSAAVCGNRAHVAAYRARRRQGTDG